MSATGLRAGPLFRVAAACGLAGAAVFLAQLWFAPLLPVNFLRVLLTLGVVGGVALLGAIGLRERDEARRQVRGRLE